MSGIRVAGSPNLFFIFLMSITTFSGLGLRPEILSAISEMGFEAPTPVQSECIPYIIEGRDIMGQAQTGTGKTAAFGIPALELLDDDAGHVQVLIMCPTRELAIQVTGEIQSLGKKMNNLNVVPVYGGQPIDRQLRALRRKTQIVVGTPGRVIDHLKRKTLDISSLKMVVLDEADEMLNMGFREDIEKILSHTGDNVQSIMFSATNTPGIRGIMQKQMKNPQMISIDKKVVTAPQIAQYIVEVRDSMRVEAISRLMDVNNYKLGLVFCNTKRKCDEVVTDLQARGYRCDVLHGDITQNGRDKVMGKFRRDQLDLLVATDVAARGIDVEHIDVVFNFDVPQDPEYYVHRIGRTGRAGRSGTAITFSAGRKKKSLRFIEKQIRTNLIPMAMPSTQDVEASRAEGLISDVLETLEKGGLKSWIEYVESIETKGYSPMEIAAACLKMNVEGNEKPQAAEQGVGGASTFHEKTGEPMTTLFISVGKNKKIRPGDIVGAIAGETGLPGKAIGNIEIRQNHCLVDVPAEKARGIISVMDRNQIKGTRIMVKLDEMQ